jgi:tetratricopeptide (TPR) repeat protein
MICGVENLTMKRSGIALAFLLLAQVASAQEDLDQALKSLAEKLSKDGLSGQLAETAATDAGLQAIKERIEFLLAPRISRYERDPIGAYEDALFFLDENGDLRLRPDRKLEMNALQTRLASSSRAMAGFIRRADDIARRLGTFSEMDRRAKIAWSDPAFRIAFFHRHPAELREMEDAEILDAAGFRGLERRKDGRLHVGGPFAQEIKDRLAATFEQLEAVKRYEKSFLKQVAQVADAAARTALAADSGILFLIGRVLRQVGEGLPTPVGALTEGDENAKVEPAITFTRALHEFVPELQEVHKQLEALKTLLDALAGDIAPEGTENLNVLEFLKNDRARVLLAERVLWVQQEQKKKAAEIMNATIEESFTVDDERLAVKKGVFVGDNGADSPDALSMKLNTVIEEFHGALRQDFERIAERCVEPEMIAMFENQPGTYLLMEHRDRVIEELTEAVRRQGADVFTKAYLQKQGDSYVVRPDRAGRVGAILKRAEEIKKGQ